MQSEDSEEEPQDEDVAETAEFDVLHTTASLTSLLGDSQWHIPAAEIQICRHPDGTEVALGQGGFGVVYQAVWNEVLEVAVKRIQMQTPAQLAHFTREMAILKSCHSAYVVQCLGAVVEEGSILLVTELMAGGNLHTLLHSDSQPYSWRTRYQPCFCLSNEDVM